MRQLRRHKRDVPTGDSVGVRGCAVTVAEAGRVGRADGSDGESAKMKGAGEHGTCPRRSDATNDLDPLPSEAFAVPAAMEGRAEERGSHQGKRRWLRNGGERAEQPVHLAVDARREEQGVGCAGGPAIAEV